MAAGFLRTLGGDRVEVRSAGSAPKDTINPVAVEAMAELGIDIHGEQPKLLSTEAVEASDVVITMGCGDACPYYPGKRYEDWVLDDPAGQGIESVRVIRDQIRARVLDLLKSWEMEPLDAQATPIAPSVEESHSATGRHAMTENDYVESRHLRFEHIRASELARGASEDEAAATAARLVDEVPGPGVAEFDE